MKAWCSWCETPIGGVYPKHGYLWIHEDCAFELMSCVGSDVKTVLQILNEEHPRNEKTKDKLDCIIEFINDMDASRKRWEGTMKLIDFMQRKAPPQPPADAKPAKESE